MSCFVFVYFGVGGRAVGRVGRAVGRSVGRPVGWSERRAVGRACGRTVGRALLFRRVAFESFPVNPFFFHASALRVSPAETRLTVYRRLSMREGSEGETKNVQNGKPL